MSEALLAFQTSGNTLQHNTDPVSVSAVSSVPCSDFHSPKRLLQKMDEREHKAAFHGVEVWRCWVVLQGGGWTGQRSLSSVRDDEHTHTVA